MYYTLLTRIYRPVDEPQIANEYFRKHMAALEHYGVGGVSSMKPDWIENPNVYMYCVYDEKTGEMVAGMRLAVADSAYLLPMVSALSKDFKEIQSIVQMYHNDGGFAELCGLWVDREYSRLYLPKFLTYFGLALAPGFGVRHVTAFANNHSRKFIEQMGFEKLTLGPNNGTFFYPDSRYETSIMYIEAADMVKAPDSVFKEVAALRNEPHNVKIEVHGDHVIEMIYDLNIEKVRAEKFVTI